jgi:hypothetical protein
MATAVPVVASPVGGFQLSVTAKPGAFKLDHVKYPLLVYAPLQWGPGIRTEDNGTLVHDIAVASSTVTDYDALARQFGTTGEHVRQAIAYALEAHGVTAQ